MKELDPHTPEAGKDKQEVHVTIPAKAEQKYLGSFQLQRGMKLYQYNFATKEISEVEYKTTYTLGGSAQRKAVVKEGHRFFAAINKANAQRKVDAYLKEVREQIINHLKEQAANEISPEKT